jgi:hypothetical protein
MRWGVRLFVLAALLALAHTAWGNLELYRQRVERAERLRVAIATEQARATRLAEQARYVRRRGVRRPLGPPGGRDGPPP